MHASATAAPADRFAAEFVRPRGGRTLVVGSRIYGGKADRRALYADAVGADMQAGPGVDVVVDLEEPGAAAALGRFDHVECISVLEHARRPWLVAATIEAVLVPGGTLHLQVPFVWRVHDYPGDLWRFTDQGVRALFSGITWSALMYASDDLRKTSRLRGQQFGPTHHPHMPRCEVCGFGVRS